MSLVDYAASSDEDEPQSPPQEQQNEKLKQNPEKPHLLGVSGEGSSSAPPLNNDPVNARNRMPTTMGPPASKQTESVSSQSSELKLPDASFLLNSPVVPSNANTTDHSSRVAAAMAESAARKRELKGSPATYPRTKIPKGTLRHSKNVPETVGGRLLPPQLAGRSNIVTEDISKLFVRKSTNSSTE